MIGFTPTHMSKEKLKSCTHNLKFPNDAPAVSHMTCIILLQYHGAPLLLVDILSYMNMTFTLCFTVECVLKLISYGPGVNSSKCDEGPSISH